MNLLLIISIITFITYITYVMVKFGIQKSISDSYYDLDIKNKIFFTLALWGFALPIGIAAETTMLFLAAAGICFVGATPAFKDDKTEHTIHMIGAYSGIILGFASMVIDYHLYWLTGISVVGITLIYLFGKNKIWWIEVLAFLIIWLAVMNHTII